MTLSPNGAFCVLLGGILAGYGEFIRPGSIWLGALGGGASLIGAYFLWQAGPSLLGLVGITLGWVLLAMDAVFDSRFLLGIGGTVALVAGFSGLFQGALRIQAPFAITGSLLFGAITVGLNWFARRARQNKHVS